jgi:hypothetical protein
MKKLTGAMRERGFCTWLALTWSCESNVEVADFAFLETSLGMRGYEDGAFRAEYASRLRRERFCDSPAWMGLMLGGRFSVT